VTATAASVGLEFHLDGTLSGDTLDAHRLIKLAATQGLAAATVERFYRAYFSENISLFNRDNLLKLAQEAGLEQSSNLTVLDDARAFAAEVEADEAQVRTYGVSGVPFFVIDNRYGVSGAQGPEVFAQALSQAWREKSSSLTMTNDGPVCGPEGCA
jgi:predicted DsbA family dithiol-disulfide isomerase